MNGVPKRFRVVTRAAVSATMREKIQKRWFEIRKGKSDEPERAEDYELLHAAFASLTFATLYAVVHEFDE